MFGLENLSGSAQAGATVGVVLAEAFGLYLVYGVLSDGVGAAVIAALGGD